MPPMRENRKSSDPAALIERLRETAPHTYAAGLVQAYRQIRLRGEDPYSVRQRLVAHAQQLESSGKIRPVAERTGQLTTLERYADSVGKLQGMAESPMPDDRDARSLHKKKIRAAELTLEQREVELVETAATAREVVPKTAPPRANRRPAGRGMS